MLYLAGLPYRPMSSMPLRMPPTLRMIRPVARPIAALAMSPGFSAPVPLLMRMSIADRSVDGPERRPRGGADRCGAEARAAIKRQRSWPTWPNGPGMGGAGSRDAPRPLRTVLCRHRKIARRWVRIEHVNSSFKRRRILTETIRMWKDGMRDMVMEIGCTLYNLRVRLTPSWTPILSLHRRARAMKGIP